MMMGYHLLQHRGRSVSTFTDLDAGVLSDKMSRLGGNSRDHVAEASGMREKNKFTVSQPCHRLQTSQSLNGHPPKTGPFVFTSLVIGFAADSPSLSIRLS